MTRRCNGNPAQYERNRRFGHLVHVLGWSANGAKLPSERLKLNASKARISPRFCDDTYCSPPPRQAPIRAARPHAAAAVALPRFMAIPSVSNKDSNWPVDGNVSIEVGEFNDLQTT